MLFYQQKELDKYLTFKNILFGSLFLHVLIIFITFFISTIKKNENAILINLSNKAFRAAPISFSNKSKGNIVGINNNLSSKNFISKNILKQNKVFHVKNKKNNLINKKIIKKIDIISHPKELRRKLKNKKFKNKLLNNKSKQVSQKTDDEHEYNEQPVEPQKKEDNINQDDKNTIEQAQQQVVKEEKKIDLATSIKAIENNSEIVVPENCTINLDEICSLDIVDRSVHDAIVAHFYIPPGFDSSIKYTISFEIGFEGDIKNISLRKDEPLALYTAMKQAILKAEFPRSKWGSKIELIY